MSGKELSTVLIEPTRKVVETLRLAVLHVGPDGFVRRTNSSIDVLERWINGKDWVPLLVVKEACEMNRNRPDAPSYSTLLSDCTLDAEFRIVTMGQHEGSASPHIEGITAPKTGIPEKARMSQLSTRQKASRRIAEVTVVMAVAPLLGAAIGYTAAGPLGASAGVVSSFALVSSLVFYMFARSK